MEKQKCDECNKGRFVKKKVDYILLDINLGRFDAFVCNKCKETIFEGKESKKIELKAKEAGIWNLAAKTVIGTSGTALDIKIPKAIVNFMSLEKGNSVIIEPIAKNKIYITIE